jgi:glycosyltransferase involved in cell wall biosynthesis
MKVLFIHNCAERSGAAHSLLWLIEGLKELDVTPVVACPPGQVFDFYRQQKLDVREGIALPYLFSGSGTPLRGLRLIPFGLSLLDFRNLSRFRSMVSEIQPDLVHLNERNMIFSAKQIHRLGIPVVMHARNVACQEVRWAQKMCESYVEKYVDRLIAIDESVQRSLPNVSRCSVVYNPLNCVDSFKPRPSANRNQPKTLLFLSNLMDVKGVWDLLEAVKILKHRDDFHLLIVGGNSRPAEFFQTVKGKIAKMLGIVKEVDKQVLAFVAQHGLESKVTLKGFVNDIGGLIEGAYINVFPSHLNGPSRSVYETGLAGVPSVLALKTLVEDVVKDGVNGLIVPEKSPAHLATAIARLLDSSEERDRLGSNAQQQYRTQFSKEKSAADVLAIYQSVLKRRTTV